MKNMTYKEARDRYIELRKKLNNEGSISNKESLEISALKFALEVSYGSMDNPVYPFK